MVSYRMKGVDAVYYRELVPKEDKCVYDSIEAGLLSGQPCFRVPVRRIDVLSEYAEWVHLDHPALFWTREYSFRTVRGAEYTEMSPRFLYSPSERAQLKAALEKRTERLLAPMRELAPWNAVGAIHDFVLSSMTYMKPEKAYSHEIIGALNHGIGVCEGIAKTVKHFCDRLGIPCIVVIGQGRPPEEGSCAAPVRHAWNLISLSGKWMHFDMTFDLSCAGGGADCRDYFGLSDARVFLDHEQPEYPIPEAKEGIDWYASHRLAPSTEKALSSLLSRTAKKNGAVCFSPRGENSLRSAAQISASVAEENGKKVLFSANSRQNGAHVRFFED